MVCLLLSTRPKKQSVTGNGNATKEQVARMLQTIFKIEESPDHYDATDALAVAFCHHLQSGSGWKPPATTSKKKSTTTKGKRDQWAAFISKNAERIRK
jgi:crossover junction endodeoxyribonuclease RuvC